MGTLVFVSKNYIEKKTLQEVSKILLKGGCAVVPTFCLYGMVANALDEAAVRRIFKIKRRSLQNPILLLIKDEEAVDPLVKKVPEAARQLMGAFWPGNLTLVFEASEKVPDIITSGTGKVGLRVPSNSVTRAICQSVPFPLTGTSANIAGDPGASDASELHPKIIKGADITVHSGKLAGRHSRRGRDCR